MIVTLTAPPSPPLTTEVMPSPKSPLPETPSRAATTTHLAYLDGLRGIAAVYVVLHHVWQCVVNYPQHFVRPLPPWFRVTNIFELGAFAVDVFIVLSGYCLMLPVARSAEGELRGGIMEFARRRAVRILPPYFAALALSLLLIAVDIPLRTRIDATPSGPIGLSVGSVVTHLFLVHNLTPSWSVTLNGPMWSVALEWQIYFVFALLLLPLWRRFGIKWALGAALLGGMLLIGQPQIHSWLLGLFGMGMAAAVVSVRPSGPRRTATHGTIPWFLLSAVFGGLVVALLTMGRALEGNLFQMPLLDSYVGAATACFLIGGTDRLLRGTPDHKRLPLLLQVLASRPAQTLGQFSYSLYLIHYPLLCAFNLRLMRFALPPEQNFFVLMLLFTPVCLGLAYLFYLACERPFLRRRALTLR